MAQVTFKHNGKYNIYTTISDGFYWESGLTLDQLTEYVKEEEGNQGINKMQFYMPQVEKCGSSSQCGRTLEDAIRTNRMGEDGAPLTKEECLKFFD